MDLVCFPRPPPSKTRRGLPDGAGSAAQGAAQGSGPQLPPPDWIPNVPVQVTPSVHFAFPVSEAASWPPLHPAATQGMEQWVLQLDMAQIPWEHPSLGAARPIFSLNSGFFPSQLHAQTPRVRAGPCGRVPRLVAVIHRRQECAVPACGKSSPAIHFPATAGQ